MRRKKIIYLVGVVVVLVTTAIVVLLSRGGNGYMNVIPSRVKALVAVELSKIGVGDVPGVDFSRKAYLFETADGSLGLVAAVDSKSDVESFLESMQKSGKATKPVERKGYLFTVINDNFVVGVSSSAVLVMGPAVADEQASIQRKMVKYLSSDVDAVSESPLFRQLSTLDGPVTIVAQADALPEKFVMPLTLGAPRGTKADELLLSATMDINGECLTLKCRTFSLDDKINNALKTSHYKQRPITDKYLATISADNLLTVACNAKGTDFVELLRSNESLRTMLIGINTAIDIDKMLRGVDGDLIISLPSLGDNLNLTLLADASDISWMQDVDYWKKSCPAGTQIESCGRDSYRLKGTDFDTCFGVKDGKLLYVAPSTESVANIGSKASHPLSPAVVEQVKGSRFAAVLSLSSATRQKPELSVVSSFLPNLKTIVLKIE